MIGDDYDLRLIKAKEDQTMEQADRAALIKDRDGIAMDNRFLRERIAVLESALQGMVVEWEKMTRYGSPLAKAANENLERARAALAARAKP